ncbi:NUDIX domain-containing protein [Micromonospora zamorensis]|uniref:NUDIX domain-containing protein n=1 Tax=Micromonospora zamorensis TaxID=709883 RepID=UPI0037AB92B0
MWEVPGGTVEPDESPADACTRVIREELGLSVPAGRLFCVDWVPASPPWDGGLMFVFDGGVLTAEQVATMRLCPDELDRFEFVEPERLGGVLIPRLARRVTAAIGRGGVRSRPSRRTPVTWTVPTALVGSAHAASVVFVTARSRRTWSPAR